jgi:hypothetical protein
LDSTTENTGNVLVQALDSVVGHGARFPFGVLVDSLDELDVAFRKAADRSVLRAAIVP